MKRNWSMMVCGFNKNMPAYNKPLAIMAVEVKNQAFVPRKNISDDLQCSEFEAATIANAKMLAASEENSIAHTETN